MRFRFADGYGTAIVRTNRSTTSEARAAITTLTDVNDDPIRVHVMGISGTVQGCEEKYLGQDPISVTEQSVVFNNELRAAVVREKRIDVEIGDGFTGATTLDVE
jgi:ribonuclease P/MRP protein subunit POP5